MLAFLYGTDSGLGKFTYVAFRYKVVNNTLSSAKNINPGLFCEF